MKVPTRLPLVMLKAPPMSLLMDLLTNLTTDNLPFVEEPLEIVKPLEDQTIDEDQTVKFTCEVSKPNIKSCWYKDGKAVSEKDGYRIETINSVHTLILDNVAEEDGGKYSIKVEDKQSEATLTVKVLPIKFVQPLADITVTEKQEIFLEVKINKPGQTPVWTFENKDVSTSKRIRLTSDGVLHRLVIESADLEDEGSYKVAFGDVESSANVFVDEEPLEIVKPLEDQTIDEDQTVKFTCEVSKPNIKSCWYKDGKAVSEKDGYRIETINSVHTLILDNVAEEDGGNYSIKVEDKQSEATLTVKVLPIKFVQPLADITVTEKQEIFLEVKINKPGQTPVWTFENKDVSTSKRIRLTSDGVLHRLVIESADLEDEGSYKVAFGDVESSANVFVDGLAYKFDH
ncbi:immunoglobulin superfamily member 22-like [Haliotis asinina]|uniref:immunoglobulin superfamily member 22-like n=1 Tax=Haliotis asinina TaxID=109174 RepID=UPI003531B4C1